MWNWPKKTYFGLVIDSEEAFFFYFKSGKISFHILAINKILKRQGVNLQKMTKIVGVFSCQGVVREYKLRLGQDVNNFALKYQLLN